MIVFYNMRAGGQVARDRRGRQLWRSAGRQAAAAGGRAAGPDAGCVASIKRGGCGQVVTWQQVGQRAAGYPAYRQL